MNTIRITVLNLVFTGLQFVVMLPVGLAEGRFGRGCFAGGALLLSVVMTFISLCACGVIGEKSLRVMRGLSAVASVWCLVSLVLFVIGEQPEILRDIARYKVGALVSVALVVMQACYNRRRFLSLLCRGGKPRPN